MIMIRHVVLDKLIMGVLCEEVTLEHGYELVEKIKHVNIGEGKCSSQRGQQEQKS